jgi:hypothetical protein
MALWRLHRHAAKVADLGESVVMGSGARSRWSSVRHDDDAPFSQSLQPRHYRLLLEKRGWNAVFGLALIMMKQTR